MKITNLKQGVKNPERVNVFVDGMFSFSLDISQVVEFRLKVGMEISEEELAKFKNASDFGKLYQRTLEWVLIRPRSEKEVRDYLARKLRASSEFSEQIINRLIEKKYLDDYKFAKWYVENRFVKKGISKKRLQMELMKKGISKDIIDEVLDVRNDEEEILKIIAKKRNKYADDDKLISYLCRQGFSFELARSLVRSCERD
ncbi:RecX family transcriptional regulator [Candidatus Saccharibacteria bacterium]|nr:RecX family transcriptional regulator [Candidatus Saccharibacteria bacterium]